MQIHFLKRIVFCCLLAPALAWAAAWHETGDVPAAVRASLVQVEVALGTDDGDEPRADGWRSRCPNCGEYHVTGVDSALRERRPVTVPGFLVGPDEVVMADPQLEARFMRSWHVRFGDSVVRASSAALAMDRGALRLKLEKPLASARPLQFSAAGKGPYFLLTYSDGKDGFGTQLLPLPSTWITKADGRRFLPVPASSILLAGDGSPVTLTLSEELAAGDVGRRPPAEWPWIPTSEYQAKVAETLRVAKAGVVRATLVFRTPKNAPGAEMAEHDDSPDNPARRPVFAAVIAPRRVLVLAALMPRQTARLEKVVLALPGGREIPASFVATLSELGAFVAEPKERLDGILPVSTMDWPALRGRPVLTARFAVQGDALATRGSHVRLVGIRRGFGNRLVPEFAGDAESLFLFDLEGRLLGLPITSRPLSTGQRWESSGSPFSLPARELAAFAGDTAAFADARNVPQSAEDEQKLAWLGVDLQPLDRELAQVHGVLAQMEKGGGGALVIHVYPGSPAARAGIETGDVLLRAQAGTMPKPVPLQVAGSRFAFQQFPWDRYDEISEAYYDQIPVPWSSAESEVTGLLKDFGFGTKYRLDYSRNGQMRSADLVVETGPKHYGVAAQAEVADIGVSVRDLTFETRRYFQIPEGQPGVIVSRVVAGGRGSVGGIKPYELVLAVNDQPVRTVAEFNAAAKAGGSLALSVRRMQQQRVVNITPAR